MVAPKNVSCRHRIPNDLHPEGKVTRSKVTSSGFLASNFGSLLETFLFPIVFQIPPEVRCLDGMFLASSHTSSRLVFGSRRVYCTRKHNHQPYPMIYLPKFTIKKSTFLIL